MQVTYSAFERHITLVDNLTLKANMKDYQTRWRGDDTEALLLVEVRLEAQLRNTPTPSPSVFLLDIESPRFHHALKLRLNVPSDGNR